MLFTSVYRPYPKYTQNVSLRSPNPANPAQEYQVQSLPDLKSQAMPVFFAAQQGFKQPLRVIIDYEGVDATLQQGARGSGRATLKAKGGNTLGSIDVEGNFNLKDGRKGSVFESDTLALPSILLPSDRQDIPFLNRLRSHAEEISKHNTPGPWVRRETGLTGKDIPVWISEGGGNAQDADDHQEEMLHALTGSTYGIAPGVKAILTREDNEFRRPVDINMPGDMRRALGESFSSTLEMYVHKLETCLQQALRSPDHPKILNISNSLSPCDLYEYFIKKFLPTIASQSPAVTMFSTRAIDPEVRAIWDQVNLPATNHLNDQQLQFMIDYCDGILSSSSLLTHQIQRFNALARELLKHDVLIVIAAGNEHNFFPPGVRLRPDAEWSLLSRNPYVVTVAGSNVRQHPEDISFHQVAPKSSRGYDEPGNFIASSSPAYPTLTAPGEWLYTEKHGISKGTSVATINTSGICALMLEANPKLSAQELKECLTEACENPNGVDRVAVGNGFLNPLKAIELAKQK